jgi:hypothetical protein
VATRRTVLVVAYTTLVLLAVTACQQVNEAVNDRDLDCSAARDDICTQLADYVSAEWLRLNAASGPIIKVVVSARGCPTPPPAANRCWLVEATTRSGAGGGEVFFEREDGTLFNSDGVRIEG